MSCLLPLRNPRGKSEILGISGSEEGGGDGSICTSLQFHPDAFIHMDIPNSTKTVILTFIHVNLNKDIVSHESKQIHYFNNEPCRWSDKQHEIAKKKHMSHTNSGMPHDFMIHFTIDNYIHLHTKTIYRSVV